MDLRNLLFAEAVLGRDAEEFLATDLGRYLVGRCDQEIEEAQAELSRVSPWRRRRIQQLQNTIWRAQSFKGWLGALITDGHAAQAALEDQE